MSHDNPKRFSVWQAIQFVWHYRWSPYWHAEGTCYDEAAGITRCPCGRTWGAS